MLKTFVCTRGDLSRFRIFPQILPAPDLDITVFCHTEEDKARIADGTEIPRDMIVPLNPPDLGIGTIGWLRETVVDRYVDDDEWYAFFDDNPIMQAPPEPFYSMEKIDFLMDAPSVETNWHHVYATVMTPEQVSASLFELIAKCEEQGTTYGGCAGEPNYFYRPKKWSVATYIRAKYCVARKDHINWTWHPDIPIFTDFARTVKCIADFGSVACNRFVHCWSKLCEPGGIGSQEYRIPYFEVTSRILREMYPGLVDKYRGSSWSMTIKKRTLKQIENWRREHGYID